MEIKVVALVNQNQTIKDACERIHQRNVFLEKQVDNLQKQAKEVSETTKNESKPDWAIIEEALNDDNLLDGYNKTTHYLTFSIKKNCIELVEDGTDNPFKNFIERLLR